jgi:hypothetical protein
MKRRRERHQLPIEEVRAQRDEEFRATPTGSPGTVRVAVNDDETGNWAEIEVGTGDIPELIRLLEDACADAQAALEAAMRDRGRA